MQPPRTATYLLRFDDLCPTMNWAVWAEIEAALIEHRLKPLLAVVPDNQDPVLQVAPAAGDFWERVRQWQARGWTIALHGFQHQYVARRAGLVTPKKLTEFAGVPAAEQAEKLRRGVEIFAREGIKPQVWIAPNNSFDATTVSLLPQFGIRIVCDGYFRFPFLWPREVVWVPQQLFGFRPAPAGVWTVCYHHNHWTAADLARFQEDVRRFRADLGSLEDVLAAWPGRRSWWPARLCFRPRWSQLLIRAELKCWAWRAARRNPPGAAQPAFRPVEQSNTSN